VDRLNLNLLPIAHALYDERSVSGAAKALGMSQPAVSMALRKLRAHFNDPLFIRAARGVEPTPRARALVEASRPLVTRLQEELLAERAFDAPRSTRAFTLALFDIGEMVFLPRLISGLRAEAPHCAIRSVSLPPEKLARGLEKAISISRSGTTRISCGATSSSKGCSPPASPVSCGRIIPCTRSACR
jgi:DNA-binding transcriptional LysR family regulator